MRSFRDEELGAEPLNLYDIQYLLGDVLPEMRDQLTRIEDKLDKLVDAAGD